MALGFKHDPAVPPELTHLLSGVGGYAAGANVIMQLSKLPIGRGVAESRVESGRVDAHPIKRLRTTMQFVAVALFGTDEDRNAIRSEINRAHRDVHSVSGDPVEYNAFDPHLQLWVAACLYKGIEDVLLATWGDSIDDDVLDRIYAHCAHLGTTLQVKSEMWPVDRDEFARYWEKGVAEIEMDEVTRSYLQGIAKASFLPHPFDWIARGPAELTALGFLPPEFRDLLGLPWSQGRQRAFDRLVAVTAAVSRLVPDPIEALPINLYLWDARRRFRSGKSLV